MEEENVIATVQETCLPILNRERVSAENWMRTRWETDIRHGFSELDKIDANNPQIEELREYAKTLEEKFDYLRRPVGVTPQQAELLMARIPKEDRDAGFDAAILRIAQETEYLDELDDVGISAALVAGLENGKYGAYVKFLAPDSFFAKRMIKGGALAAYNPLLDRVHIPTNTPASEEMWLMLATEGQLPSVVSSLDHELTHNSQWSRKQRATILGLQTTQALSYFALLQKYGVLPALGISNAIGVLSRQLSNKLDNDEMLEEIHAFEAAASSPSIHTSKPQGRIGIAEHVTITYKPQHRNMVDALNAYDQIHTLRILGLDDKKIGKIVNLAKFDKKTRTYPKIEEVIAEQKIKWGITDDNDFRSLRKTLLAQHDLELKYQRHRGQEIAARELERETGNWQIP